MTIGKSLQVKKTNDLSYSIRSVEQFHCFRVFDTKSVWVIPARVLKTTKKDTFRTNKIAPRTHQVAGYAELVADAAQARGGLPHRNAIVCGLLCIGRHSPPESKKSTRIGFCSGTWSDQTALYEYRRILLSNSSYLSALNSYPKTGLYR